LISKLGLYTMSDKDYQSALARRFYLPQPQISSVLPALVVACHWLPFTGCRPSLEQFHHSKTINHFLVLRTPLDHFLLVKQPSIPLSSTIPLNALRKVNTTQKITNTCASVLITVCLSFPSLLSRMVTSTPQLRNSFVT
jgi:hypothetical protein